ncbi:MAG: ADP-ribosylglycohydrolase family protein [bacterium]|nr:ADP-ribosylglycohydrolase family protein [bacterium]
MLGAIIGDIAGSRFEWDNIKTKDFDLLTCGCFPTDDSIMSLAVAKAILESEGDCARLEKLTVSYMQMLGRQYPNGGYGGRFHKWLYAEEPRPYNSFGNGAAMRVSPCGFAASTLDEALSLARAVTRVTHNHPEGMKAAEAVSAAIFWARNGKSLPEIRDSIESTYYKINFTLDSIRPTYAFDETCQGSVPQAFAAFFESTGFEDAIRNAISIGGDSDTIAAIAGGMAEAYYGIPSDLRKNALTFLDKTQLDILNAFEAKFEIIAEKYEVLP